MFTIYLYTIIIIIINVLEKLGIQRNRLFTPIVVQGTMEHLLIFLVYYFEPRNIIDQYN